MALLGQGMKRTRESEHCTAALFFWSSVWYRWSDPAATVERLGVDLSFFVVADLQRPTALYSGSEPPEKNKLVVSDSALLGREREEVSRGT